MSILRFIFRNRNAIIGQKKDEELDDDGNLLNPGIFTGGVVIDASMKEVHDSDCNVTTNPVEDGVAVADHVQILPKTLSMEGVVTDTPVSFSIINNVTGLISTATSLFGASSRSKDAYDDLLKLRDERQPFRVVTGLQVYDNMILEKLSITRTAQTGKAINFRALLREIAIVKSEVISTAANRGDLAKKNKDLGKKDSNALPAESPDAVNTTSATSSRPNVLFELLEDIGGLGDI